MFRFQVCVIRIESVQECIAVIHVSLDRLTEISSVTSDAENSPPICCLYGRTIKSGIFYLLM